MPTSASLPLPLELSPSLLTCKHCGNPVPLHAANNNFCCSGCEAVFAWIQEHRLGKFYELKEQGNLVRPGKRVSAGGEDYSTLDETEFLELYSWKTSEGRWLEFFLEGVHCAACVWLTDRLRDLVAGVEDLRLNLGSGVLKICLNEKGSFAAVARELSRMGYRPHPIRQGEQMQLRQREDRIFLIRLGIAAGCSGNIMLLAVSLYSGVNGAMGTSFQWLSFGLFVPVLTYSLIPFYESAWRALRNKTVSIDIPVVFGIVIGTIVSVINLLNGDDRIYFDSLAALVFLLLSTRYLLRRTQASAGDALQFFHFGRAQTVRRWDANKNHFSVVSIESLQVKDRVQVLAGELIPVDGIVQAGQSSLDRSLLTGEERADAAAPGDLVFAGTRNLDAPLVVEVTQSGVKTRIGKIVAEMEKLLAKKADIASFADRVSRYFVAAVILLAAFTFAYEFPRDWQEALNRALAIVIVTCPCTFALITPLAFSSAIGRLAKLGILVKGAKVLESLAGARTVFLDKTGTLTVGQPQVAALDLDPSYWPEVLAIELNSAHPAAQAIVAYLRASIARELPKVEAVKETIGLGIQGRIAGNIFELRRASSPTLPYTQIVISKNGVAIGSATLEDEVRGDGSMAVASLRDLGLAANILSGDNQSSVHRVAKLVGIEHQNCFSEMSPEQKASVIRSHPGAVMVGDGANDALALAQASVGIAMHSGLEISLRAADVYLGTHGIRAVTSLFVIAQETMIVVRRNLAFSLVYNVAAAAFAVAGKIDPLFAAVLMPASALTVLFSTLIGTRRQQRAFQEINK